MSGYLLDTNVLSEVIKKRPEPSVLARLREVAPGSVFTSVVCVTELRCGARRRPGAEVLWERIAREVLSRVRVLPFGGQGWWIYWVGPIVGMLLAVLACSVLAKEIEVAKPYHFDSGHDRPFRRTARPR